MMNVRDQIRSRALGARQHFRSEKVSVRFPDPETGAAGEAAELEVRQPSVRERAAILKAGGASPGKQTEGNFGELQVTAVIACTFVPSTGQRLFDESDKAGLLETPAGGWLDDLCNVAMKLLDVKAEELEKK